MIKMIGASGHLYAARRLSCDRPRRGAMLLRWVGYVAGVLFGGAVFAFVLGCLLF